MDPAARDTILQIMDDHPDMTVATVRPDGFPQASTVTFVHEGLTVYFACDLTSQKAQNIARDPKVSATIDKPHDDWNEIRGLSLGGLASHVTDEAEVAKVSDLIFQKFPQVADYMTGVSPDSICVVRIDPVAISVLDYSKGFGHCDLVEV